MPLSKFATVLVGLGNMGKKHLSKLCVDPDFELVAVVEPHIDALFKQGFQIPVKAVARLADLDPSSFSHAVVATPTETHFTIVEELLRGKKHVLVEKPMAATYEECVRLKACADESKMILRVGHIERFNPAVSKLMRLIEHGLLGDVVQYTAVREGKMPAQVKEGNNVIVDLAVHDLDILAMLIGELNLIGVDRVSLSSQKIVTRATLHLRSMQQTRVLVHASWLSEVPKRYLEVTGTMGRATLDYMTQSTRFVPFGSISGKLRETVLEATDALLPERQDQLSLEYREFAKALRGQSSRLCSPEGALNLAAISEQALEKCNDTARQRIFAAHQNERTFFISAGEHSGDMLAGELAVQLGLTFPEHKAYGVVGDAMLHAGVRPLASVSELSVMGVFEVAGKLAQIRTFEQRLLEDIDRLKPEFAVLVDAPSFHMRLAEQLTARGIPVFQYVAPQLWAWGANRVKALAKNYLAVFGFLPFEQEYFRSRGVNYHYVGTPHLDRARAVRLRREDVKLAVNECIIGFFPGSRVSEIKRILPHMLAVVPEIHKRDPNIRVVISLAASLNDEFLHPFLAQQGFDLKKASAHWRLLPSEWYQFNDQKVTFAKNLGIDLMSIVDAALVGSGTATLECGLVGTPMAVIYVMNPFSYILAKLLVRVPYIGLVNLIGGKQVAREFVQNIDTSIIAEELHELARPGARREMALANLNEIALDLKGHAARETSMLMATLLAGRRVAKEEG